MSKNTITIIIVAVVALGAGFFGGMKYQASKVPSFTRGAGAGTFAGRTGRTGGTAGAGFTGGQIISKDAQSITVSIVGGGSKIIFLSASTTVMKATTGSVSDLTVGENVTATGSANSDGSVTAQSIQIRPAGMQVGRGQ